MSGRRLKALVVHDTAFPNDVQAILGTSYIDLCSVKFREGHVQNKIGTWADVLQVLEALVAPNGRSAVNIDIPDLLFVDCHFSSDKQAPRLWADESVEEPRGKRVDPRGLIYGAVLSSYFMGKSQGRPFGFAVYSQDLEAAADNGYALTFFSILEALAGNIKANRVRAAQFAVRMKSIPRNQLPGPVLGDALAMYRAGLLSTLGADYYPVVESFEKAEAAVSKWIDSSDGLHDNLSLEWHTFSGQKESVSLSSIFADCLEDSGWCLARVEERGVLDFLRTVLGEVNQEREVLKPVGDHLRLLADVEEEGAARPDWPMGYVGYKQKTLAYIILWALDRIEESVDRRAGRPARIASVDDLNKRIALTNKEVNRALGNVLGNSDLGRGAAKEKTYKASVLIKNLDNHRVWPYQSPPWIKPLVRKFLGKHFNGRRDVSIGDWPASLRGD